MPSIEYFRMLPDEELLLHGKEATSYSDEFVVALVERFEALLELCENLDAAGNDLRQRVAELEDEISEIHT